MRIRTFCKLVECEETEQQILKNCAVVIDGQNFFYRLYSKSELPHIFGCECDKYAAYVKKYLKMFKDANIKCYIIFKGGHKTILETIKKKDNATDFNDPGKHNPVFMKDVYKQVLDEMDFEYTVSEYESKEDIIALVQKLNCPVISYDIEFCFSGIPYIPHNYDNDTILIDHDGLKVKLFKLERFLEKHKLSKRELAIFITLTDENIFGENFFGSLMQHLKFPLSPYKRNRALLKWLGANRAERALSVIYRYVNKEKFDIEMEKMNNFICKKPTGSVSAKYLENKNNFEITEKDPNWFEKGVSSGKIAIVYVNLYRSNVLFGSWVQEDNDADDSILLSIEILIYASNLLSNFNNKEFLLHDKTKNNQTITTAISALQKPEYEAVESPFENGWNKVKSLRLFEHFLQTTLQGFNYECLQKIPEDAKLLIVTLIYFSRKKHIDTTNIVCSVILSYVMLGVVSDKTAGDGPHVSNTVHLASRPHLDSTTDPESVTESDATAAVSILKNYFRITDYETRRIFKEKTVHPLIEFQHCLTHMNYLNKLCGSTYAPTIYSKTYNGTFVYKFLHEIENNKTAKGGRDFIMQIMNPAATVLAYFNGIFDTYQELMYS